MLKTAITGLGLPLVESYVALTPQKKAILAQMGKAAAQWAENQIRKNHGIVPSVSGQKSTQHQLQIRESIASGQRRGIVTASTKGTLNAIHGSLATLPPGIPPYQKPGGCDTQARNIIQGVQEVYQHSRTAQRANEAGSTGGEKVGKKDESLWQRLWKSLREAMEVNPTIKEVDAPKSADQLLDLYNKNGPFFLRGPKLGDPAQESRYIDHAIAIMAAVKVWIDGQGEKIVCCVIDCNDDGTDEETTVARQQAAKLGKNLSDLTHEEAGSGAETRRIRLVNADPIIERSWNYAWHMKFNAFDIEMPKSAVVIGGKRLLTDAQTKQLEDCIVKNWSEVEDYPVEGR